MKVIEKLNRQLLTIVCRFILLLREKTELLFLTFVLFYRYPSNGFRLESYKLTDTNLYKRVSELINEGIYT